MVERKPERLPIGTQVGFGPTYADVPSALEDRPQGYDLVVDATGVPVAIEAAFGAVAKGGRFLQVGVAPPEASVPILPYRIYYEEITVLGSMAVLDSYAPAVQLIADGTVKVGPLLTHNLPLQSYPGRLRGATPWRRPENPAHPWRCRIAALNPHGDPAEPSLQRWAPVNAQIPDTG